MDTVSPPFREPTVQQQARKAEAEERTGGLRVRQGLFSPLFWF